MVIINGINFCESTQQYSSETFEIYIKQSFFLIYVFITTVYGIWEPIYATNINIDYLGYPDNLYTD